MSPLVDAILVNSEEGKRIHWKRGYITERMFFIPNGFDTHKYCADDTAKDWLLDLLGLRKDHYLIGLVARFDPMKGHRNFFKAASRLSRRNDRVHFVMAGKGMVPENEHLALFIDHRIKKRIHLMGLRDDIPRIMAGLDIASSASEFGEGFSNTIGEAMSCGTPCVVTDVGDSAKIVGDAGIVVPPSDPEALFDAWLRLLEMGEEERKALGTKARQRIQEHFELGKIVRRFEDFYEVMHNK